jgi:hypothetical protein
MASRNYDWQLRGFGVPLCDHMASLRDAEKGQANKKNLAV